MTLNPQSLDEINYWDLDMFVHGDPHAAWRVQREQAPIWFHDKPGGEPFWSVTSFDGVKAVHSEPELYCSGDTIMLRTDESMDAEYDAMMSAFPPIIHTDPPDHGPRRKAISNRFTPRAIGELEDDVREIAVRCIDEALDKGDIDFVTDIAHRIPAEITFRMMGIPEDRWERLAQLEHLLVAATETEFWEHEDGATHADITAEFYTYFYEVCNERLANPGDDWLSQLVHYEFHGQKLGAEIGTADAALLIAGGLDTTRAAASAGAMVPLLEHPDQLQALRDDLSLLPTAIEEFVRWASPITHEARTLTDDTELLGHQLSKGDRVAMWSPSANRDAAHFDNPNTFDITRDNNRHMGFAWGEHYCLGVHLARLTLRVEFEELFARVKTFDLTGEPRRVRSNFVGGLVRLPMHITAA